MNTYFITNRLKPPFLKPIAKYILFSQLIAEICNYLSFVQQNSCFIDKSNLTIKILNFFVTENQTVYSTAI